MAKNVIVRIKLACLSLSRTPFCVSQSRKYFIPNFLSAILQFTRDLSIHLIIKLMYRFISNQSLQEMRFHISVI